MAKILVIDDDDQLLEMIATIIQHHGHQAVLENDPEQGLTRILEEQPHLLVLDLMMPKMNGHDLCRQIRATDEIADLPVLILTARAQPVDRIAALESGADDYLSKPVAAQDFIDHIDRLLRKEDVHRPAKTAVTISCFGLRGGIGRTTIATNLAAALHGYSRQETCLVDFSPSISQATMHFRLPQQKSWSSLLPGEEMEWAAISDCLLLTASGLHILAGPEMPLSTQQLTGRAARNMLSLLQEQMQFLVLDLPAVMTPAAYSALRMSDIVFHIVNPDIIAVKSAIQSRQLLGRLDDSRVNVIHILNHARPDSQLAAPTVEKGLRTRFNIQIGHDHNQHQALAKGVPLVLTKEKSPLAGGVRQMAKAIWERSQAHA